MLFIGHDTRPHCKHLLELMEAGANAVGTKVKNIGQVTTPMVSFAVKYFNLDNTALDRNTDPKLLCDKYFETFFNSYKHYYINLKTFQKQ